MVRTDNIAESKNNGTDEANAEAVRRMVGADPILVDLKPAGEVIVELKENQFLHAGPPLSDWFAAGGALRGSVLGSLLHHGLAKNLEEAEELAKSGDIELLPANDHRASATFAGVIGKNTPVLVVENKAGGTVACATLNEGRGRALRYGANDAKTLSKLAWLEGEFAEILSSAISLSGGVDLYDILKQGLQMGDDGHSRQKAASSLFMNCIAPHMLATGVSIEKVKRALEFLAINEIFFLPLSMAAGKAVMLSIENIPQSSVVTCMALNSVEFGIKVSATGDKWFTGPLPDVQGYYFQDYGPADANPVIGDSEIAETTGLGGFAMSAAPALARYLGGSPEEATRMALEMYSITVAEHTRFKIPPLNYRGTPVGIDIRKIVDTGITPVFNTGIAHKTPGIGQIGAGYAHSPLECYVAALAALS